MRHISVKIPTKMYQDLETVAQAQDLKLSDIVRKCFRIGLKAFAVQAEEQELSEKDKFLFKQGAQYSIASYCLIEEYLKNKGSDGMNIRSSAEAKAHKIISKIYQESLNTEASLKETA